MQGHRETLPHSLGTAAHMRQGEKNSSSLHGPSSFLSGCDLLVRICPFYRALSLPWVTQDLFKARLSRLLRGEEDSALSTTPSQLQAAKKSEDEGGKEQRSQPEACSGSEVLS